MKAKDIIKEYLDIQGRDGNWDYDPYMLGLYNGLELALATLENREYVPRSLPEKSIAKAIKNYFKKPVRIIGAEQ